jgi:hypothetical protein
MQHPVIIPIIFGDGSVCNTESLCGHFVILRPPPAPRLDPRRRSPARPVIVGDNQCMQHLVILDGLVYRTKVIPYARIIR